MPPLSAAPGSPPPPGPLASKKKNFAWLHEQAALRAAQVRRWREQATRGYAAYQQGPYDRAAGTGTGGPHAASDWVLMWLYTILTIVYAMDGLPHQSKRHACGDMSIFYMRDMRACQAQAKQLGADEKKYSGTDWETELRRDFVDQGYATVCHHTKELERVAKAHTRKLVGWPFVHDPASLKHCTMCAKQVVTYSMFRPTCVVSKADEALAMGQVAKSMYEGVVANANTSYSASITAAGACGVVGGPLGAVACGTVGFVAMSAMHAASAAVETLSTEPRVIDAVVFALVVCMCPVVGIMWQMDQSPVCASLGAIAIGGLLGVGVGHLLEHPVLGTVVGTAVLAPVLTAYAARYTSRRSGWMYQVPLVYYNPYSWSSGTVMSLCWMLSASMWHSCESVERIMGGTVTEALLQSVRSRYSAFVQWMTPDSKPFMLDPGVALHSHLHAVAMVKKLSDYAAKESKTIGHKDIFSDESIISSGFKRGFNLPLDTKPADEYDDDTPATAVHTIPAFCYSGLSADAVNVPREQLDFKMQVTNAYVFAAEGAAAPVSVVLSFRATKTRGDWNDARRTPGDNRRFVPMWRKVELVGQGYKQFVVRGSTLIYDYERTAEISREFAREAAYEQQRGTKLQPAVTNLSADIECAWYYDYDDDEDKWPDHLPKKWQVRRACDDSTVRWRHNLSIKDQLQDNRIGVKEHPYAYVNPLSTAAPSGLVTDSQRRGARTAEVPLIAIHQIRTPSTYGTAPTQGRPQATGTSVIREVLFKVDDRDAEKIMLELNLEAPGAGSSKTFSCVGLDGRGVKMPLLRTGLLTLTTANTYADTRRALPSETTNAWYNDLSGPMGRASKYEHRPEAACGLCAAYLAAIDDWRSRNDRLDPGTKLNEDWIKDHNTRAAQMLQNLYADTTKKWTATTVQAACRQVVDENRDAYATHSHRITDFRRISCKADHGQNLPCSNPDVDCTVADKGTNRTYSDLGGSDVPAGLQCPADRPVCRDHRWEYVPESISSLRGIRSPPSFPETSVGRCV